jgi:DDE superfamily endonuclease
VPRLLPILKEALDKVGVLPEREPQHFAPSEPPHGEPPPLIIDGTARRRQRPKDLEKQAAHYREKKKTHWDKKGGIVQAQSKRVGFVSQTYAGKTHEKKIVDTEPMVYPTGTRLSQDTGFQGSAPDVEQLWQPKKNRARASSPRRTSARTRTSPPCASESNRPWRA